MSIAHDLKTLFQLTLAPIRGRTHRERLESFYAGQAADYDRFREHLLHGRRGLYERIQIPANGVWVEMGGGTASNLEYLGKRIGELGQVHVVDLSPALLGIAGERVARRGWSNVLLHEADATEFGEKESADLVTFSYSLTMIPDWFAALENARRLLKPGGLLGVVDFYVGRKHPPASFVRHGAATRTFWPAWFAHDNVFLSPDHVPFLHRHFTPIDFEECRGRTRYLPFLATPYYRFLGRNDQR